MNHDRITGICKQLLGRVREDWGWLINNPAAVATGMQQQLAGVRQERYGRSKEESARQLRDFRHRNRDWRLL